MLGDHIERPPTSTFLSFDKNDSNRLNSIKPPRVIPISPQTYKQKYFPEIADSVRTIVENPQKSISHEIISRTVTNICCQRLGKQLYLDLMELLHQIFTKVCQNLCAVPPEFFLFALCEEFEKYIISREVLINSFTYLEKSYLRDVGQSQTYSTFEQVLDDLYNKVVVENEVMFSKLQQILPTITPASVDPRICKILTMRLHEGNHAWANINPDLFRLYIPCLNPTVDLQSDSLEAAELLHNLSQVVPLQTRNLRRNYAQFTAYTARI